MSKGTQTSASTPHRRRRNKSVETAVTHTDKESTKENKKRDRRTPNPTRTSAQTTSSVSAVATTAAASLAAAERTAADATAATGTATNGRPYCACEDVSNSLPQKQTPASRDIERRSRRSRKRQAVALQKVATAIEAQWRLYACNSSRSNSSSRSNGRSSRSRRNPSDAKTEAEATERLQCRARFRCWYVYTKQKQ